MNILAGSNASGKSSLIQGILLAHHTWKNYQGKQISPNDIQGLNLGIPSSIIYENFSNKNIILNVDVDGEKNELILAPFEEDMYFFLQNEEKFLQKLEENKHLGNMNLFFLNAERQGPRLISPIYSLNSFSVGVRGENTGYVIGEMDKLQKATDKIHLSEELKLSVIDRFSANCEEWLKIIIPETELQHSIDMERNFSTLRFKNKGEFYLPTATGFGISYVFPIIVQALVASVVKNAVFIVENPEAHLHPYSQSTLGKFLMLVAQNGVQMIIETHSEHIIDGCRIQAVKSNSSKEMKVLFFEKKEEGSTYKDIAVLENGELEEWPDGFFDQKRLDLRALLEMRRCGK